MLPGPGCLLGVPALVTVRTTWHEAHRLSAGLPHTNIYHISQSVWRTQPSCPKEMLCGPALSWQ